jgi:hypothetical protein
VLIAVAGDRDQPTRFRPSAAAAHFAWGTVECVEIKGRSGMETVFPVIARQTRGTAPAGPADGVATPAVADRDGN